MILDPIDQRVRDQGFNFVPFNEYLAEEFRPNTLDMSGGISTLPMAQPGNSPVSYLPTINQGGGRDGDDDDDEDTPTNTTGTGKFGFLNALGFMVNPIGTLASMAAKNAMGKIGQTTAFGNTFGFGPRGKDDFGRSVSVADVEIGLDTQPGHDSSGHAGGSAAAEGAASQASDDAAAGAGGYFMGGRVPYMMGGLTDLVDIYD